MNPLISIIMPVYNQENFLAETIDSVINQTYKNFEFLILDDGSTDGSAEIIRQFLKKDSRINAYFHENSGRSEATNKLVTYAKGEWCAFLDADDIMLPHRLERQIEFHLQNPTIDGSSCYCHYINENGRILKTQRYNNLHTLEDLEIAKDKKLFIQCPYTGLMIRISSFNEAGGLDKRFDPCDDFEFFNRFIDHGFKLLIIPDILMKYRLHPAAITKKNPLYVYDKLDYTYEWIRRKRSDQPSISYNEFMVILKKEGVWQKYNRKRFHYAQLYFRSAGYLLMSQKYFKGIFSLLIATTLSPNYTFSRVLNLSKID